MSTLGKVLAIFNVLAVLAFFSLAAADYGKRQAWSYAVFRHDILLNGIPLDDKEVDLDEQPIVEKLSPWTLQQIFQGVGQPVATQVQEVQNRYKEVRGQIEAAPDDAAKRALLLQALHGMPHNWGEREEMIARIQKEPIEQLLGEDGPLDKAFRRALKGVDLKDKPLAPESRQLAIAHVLYNLSEEPAAQQRVLTVVGLKNYILAVDHQTDAIRELLQRVQITMADQRTAFEINYRQIQHRIEVMLERTQALEAALQREKALVAKHQALVTARRADVKELTERLEAAKQEAQVALAAQSRLEKELVTTQRAVGQALQTNLTIENSIRELEKSGR